MNKIIIEGKEFELPNDLVDKIKSEFLNKEEKKELTYKELCCLLFDGVLYYTTNNGNVDKVIFEDKTGVECPNHATSIRQLEKLMAINKLMNVAKFLNEGWSPNLRNSNKCSIRINFLNKIYVGYTTESNTGEIYFRTPELARQAVKILGEDVIKLALTTDY